MLSSPMFGAGSRQHSSVLAWVVQQCSTFDGKHEEGTDKGCNARGLDVAWPSYMWIWGLRR